MAMNKTEEGAAAAGFQIAFEEARRTPKLSRGEWRARAHVIIERLWLRTQEEEAKRQAKTIVAGLPKCTNHVWREAAWTETDRANPPRMGFFIKCICCAAVTERAPVEKTGRKSDMTDVNDVESVRLAAIAVAFDWAVIMAKARGFKDKNAIIEAHQIIETAWWEERGPGTINPGLKPPCSAQGSGSLHDWRSVGDGSVRCKNCDAVRTQKASQLLAAQHEGDPEVQTFTPDGSCCDSPHGLPHAWTDFGDATRCARCGVGATNAPTCKHVWAVYASKIVAGRAVTDQLFCTLCLNITNAE